MTTLDHAAAYLAAGLSVIPVRGDGTKAPAEKGWRAYAARRPSEGELRRWFHRTTAGIGIPCGPASGNLAVLDFEGLKGREGSSPFDQWLALLGPESRAWVDTCPLVRTPTDGRHLWVRLTHPAAGLVLARFSDGAVRIEVRGDGHQVVAPGSPLSVHRANRPYEFIRRGWLDFPRRLPT